MAVVVVTVGDGAIVGPLAPDHQSLLWGAAPETTRKVTRFFADFPNCMRLLDLTQIDFGRWLAFGQYREV